MNIENSILNKEFEWDNSHSGIVDEFQNYENPAEIEEKIIERVVEILSVDEEIKIVEEHLSRLKSYKNSVTHGVERIMAYKRLDYPLILNSVDCYYEIKPMVEILIHDKKFKLNEK